MKISDLKEVARLSRLTKQQLAKKNREHGRLYTGKELTKYQLIFQLIFHMDAPDTDTFLKITL